MSYSRNANIVSGITVQLNNFFYVFENTLDFKSIINCHIELSLKIVMVVINSFCTVTMKSGLLTENILVELGSKRIVECSYVYRFGKQKLLDATCFNK